MGTTDARTTVTIYRDERREEPWRAVVSDRRGEVLYGTPWFATRAGALDDAGLWLRRKDGDPPQGRRDW